ncbi:MAG: hypothetical protein KGM96_15955 [Acidobacteriota bacterium]|nr:hypothetical protein [Acidobacteriota bacterium]
MLRARSLMILLLALPAPAVGWAGLPMPCSVDAAGRAYVIRFNLNVASALPAGATVTCKARIVPNLPGQGNVNGQPAAVPVETATGVAAVTGSTAACAVEIPFSWTANNAPSGAVLSYEIEAVSVAGSLPVVVRSSAQQGIAVAYPGIGRTVSLSFDVTF